MTVADVNSKITKARKIIGLIQDKAIEFNVVMELREPLYPNDIVDVLEEYVYLLNHMKIANL